MHRPITACVALAVALTALAPPAASASPSRLPVRVIHDSGRGGIDWGDAGIGAAAGAGITLLGLGGALAVSQRHSHGIADRRRPEADPGSPPRASQSVQQRRESQ